MPAGPCEIHCRSVVQIGMLTSSWAAMYAAACYMWYTNKKATKTTAVFHVVGRVWLHLLAIHMLPLTALHHHLVLIAAGSCNMALGSY